MSVSGRASASGRRRTSTTLFLCLFASQGALIVMSPVLVQAAADLGVSAAAAGQLRTVTGLTAGLTALLLRSLAARVGLARQLLAAAVLLAAGSLGCAAAPSFAVLLLAQVPIGIAVGVLTTAALLASAEWVAPELRAHVLSWALIGQAAVWIVGMPVIGIVGEIDWRFGWLALPLPAALLSALLLASRSRIRERRVPPAPVRTAVADPALARWLGAELSANAGWTGTLVFSGALLAQSYHLAPRPTSLLLAAGACAYVAGNRLARRLVHVDMRSALARVSLLLAAAEAAFGLLRVSAAASTLLFSLAAFLAGARTLLSSSFALSAPPALRPTLTSLRAATLQLGYFVGSILGGSALALGGYGAFGAAMGLLFVCSSLTLVERGDPVRRMRRHTLRRLEALLLRGGG
jgi:predicted MFS family arabinose efflux permease